MGKVRAKTLGDETQEKKELEKTAKRKAAKTAEKTSVGGGASESPAGAQVRKTNVAEPSTASFTSDRTPAKEAPKKVVAKTGAAHRSEKYLEAAKLIDKSKTYSLTQALELLEKIHLAKFDETVELHIKTAGSLSGSMELPYGNGKTTRVAILAPGQDAKAADDLLKTIESGKIDFDVLLATPDAMPRLAKVARILGPKGLMPNPKNGTVTPKPDEAAKKYAGGHMTYKTEAKAPVLHLSVGKMSFGKEKLQENIIVAFKAIENKNMKKIVLKSTMSPAIKVQG